MKLKTALSGREKKEIIDITALNFDNELFHNDEGEYLKQKSYEVAVISTKGVLALGKIFKDVFDKLGNSKIGTYEKWINFNGFNKRTALRYRKKYELYMLVNENRKEQIALMPFDLIEKLANNIEENIKLINEGISIEELKNRLLMNKNLIIEKEAENTEFNFNIFKNLKKELKTLDSEKQQKVKVLLEEIEKVING
ncbi:hypothetical protein SAMN02745174_02643 [Cetobacterium ceti]|uniref:Uncharacterized protein n=1 Tax=Cetobacterium ceti TaxID=180163 RepID=A0A1T4RCQ9_9FUSO|nr:hypothetical protein [Cetobacterium ceti]SKA13431.1 hypothetical protein SAMN02745174_02643 [Cetobacterium ceti]